ncbi:type II toxin-antitoxin system PemK/MazF family toxin [Sphingosinicellaceae bacterium]|nr:type II toxin-antitoxin system PemK/MazF family toxin [Sphingosinicellaceae bacterium]
MPSTTSWTTPQPADVIHYRYLWRHEAERGEEDGRKDRPCLVLSADQRSGGLTVITVAITTRKYDPAHSVEIPPRVIRHLGLDDRSRIVWTDLNRFTWVGPDVGLLRGGTPYYGQVPGLLWDRVRVLVHNAAIAPVDRSV